MCYVSREQVARTPECTECESVWLRADEEEPRRGSLELRPALIVLRHHSVRWVSAGRDRHSRTVTDPIQSRVELASWAGCQGLV